MATKTTDQKQKKTSFMRGVRHEFKKIVWPSKKSVFYYSLAVVTISIIVRFNNPLIIKEGRTLVRLYDNRRIKGY